MVVAGGPSGEHSYRVVRSGGDYSQYLVGPVRFHRHVGKVDVVLDASAGIPFFSPLWQAAPVVGLVHHIHTEQWAMRFPPPVAAAGRWLESRVVPRVYRNRPVIAVSPSTAEGLVRMGFTSVTTIEMGVPEVPVVGRPSPTPRFLVLGRLVPHKRVDKALELWERVHPTTGGELVIVGDGPLRQELEAMAGASVHFTGAVDEATKARELSAAWLLVHPAHHEGWGTVVMEAASVGVPTLAFDVPGVRDSVVAGTTGVLAASDEEFVAWWKELASNDEARRTLGAAAQTRAGSFTWDRAVDAVEQLLLAAASNSERQTRS